MPDACGSPRRRGGRAGRASRPSRSSDVMSTAHASWARGARSTSPSVMRPWSNCFTDTSTKCVGDREPGAPREAGLVGDHHRAVAGSARRRDSSRGVRAAVLARAGRCRTTPTIQTGSAMTHEHDEAGATRRQAQRGEQAERYDQLAHVGAPHRGLGEQHHHLEPEPGAEQRCRGRARATGRLGVDPTASGPSSATRRSTTPTVTTTNGSRSTSVVTTRHAVLPEPCSGGPRGGTRPTGRRPGTSPTAPRGHERHRHRRRPRRRRAGAGAGVARRSNPTGITTGRGEQLHRRAPRPPGAPPRGAGPSRGRVAVARGRRRPPRPRTRSRARRR